MKTIGLILGALAIAVLGAVIGIGIYRFTDKQGGGESTSFFSNKSPVYEVKNKALPTFDFAEVSELITPTVVHIKTITNINRGNAGNIHPFDLFGDEYGFPQPVPRGPLLGSGSGVIITDGGYIVTNNHVVGMADEVEVILQDRSSYTAEVVGADPNTDLALIKIKNGKLRPIKAGNSDEVRVGEWVLAVGNPFNLTSTVTAGIVSARGRSLNILGGGTSIESFIQTDAVVNAGNSGGALVNSKGELIGINTAIATETGGYMGYAFAIPVNIVKKVVDDLIKYGEVQRGFIGVSIREIDSRLADELGLKNRQGVYIDATLPGGSADLAGLKKGDIIREIEGKKISGVPELQEIIGSHKPGDKISLKAERNGKEKEITVTLKGLEDGRKGKASRR